MAKYCGNCGSKMQDNAKVCGVCGTPFANAAKTPNMDKVVPELEQEKRKKIKKFVRLCVTLIAVIAVIGIVFSALNAFTGRKGLVRKTMKAYEDYDIEALVDMSSDLNYYGGVDYAESYFMSEVGYAIDNFEYQLGHNYKLSYEVNEIYTLSKRSMETELKDLAWMYPDFDISMIKKLAIAEVTVTARKGNEAISMELEIMMSKEHGKWKLIYIE